MSTSSKFEYAQLCNDILDAVGGSKNIKNVFHCITRLRIVPVNRDAVDMDKLSKVSGILKVVESSGQIQCVIGTTVPEVYEEFLAISGAVAGGTVDAEPASDDVPEKKPLYAAMAGGAIAGACAMLMGVVTYAFSMPGITSIATYVDDGSNFLKLLVVMAIAWLSSFAISFALNKKEQ